MHLSSGSVPKTRDEIREREITYLWNKRASGFLAVDKACRQAKNTRFIHTRFSNKFAETAGVYKPA